jgi:hypothetical protein
VHLTLGGHGDNDADDDHVVGLRHEAWKRLCAERMGGEEARRVAREAVARVLRRAAERNVDGWRRETEQVLLLSPPEGSEDEPTLA